MLIKNVSLDLIVTQFALKITLASHGAAIWRQKDGMRSGLRQDCCSPRPQNVEHSASASSASTCSVSLMRKVKHPPAHRGCFCQSLKQRARFK